jgi:hypothetical protein
MTLEHDMYGMRYWSYPLPTYPFHWGWDKEKPRKIVCTLHTVNNVIINRYIFLYGVRAELFPPPPKSSGCDFKEWIDDYMTLKYMVWVKRNEAALRKHRSSSK